MHSLQSITEVPSKKYPGVVFRVKTLNVIQRALRDQKVAAQRAEYSRLSAEREMLLEGLIGKSGTDEERDAKYKALNAEQRAQDSVLFQSIDELLQVYLIPNAIRAAFVEVTGYEVDGQALTADTLIEFAPDDLLTEAYQACVGSSGMSGDEAKN